MRPKMEWPEAFAHFDFDAVPGVQEGSRGLPDWIVSIMRCSAMQE